MNRILEVVLTGNNASLKSVLTQSATEVRAFGDTTKQANKGIEDSGGGAASSLKAVAAAGVIVAAGLGYAVAKAVEFDKNMRNVNSLTGLSEGALKSLEGQVIDMSTRLPQSAAVLSDGLYDIASSGFQGSDGLKVLNAAAVAASAGLTTTGTSAKAISAVLNAYGLTANDAADVSDTLFQAVNLGVVSFDELASSIGDTVGTAAAAKVNIAGVSSAIATMTLSGLSGAEAATSLNVLLQSLIQPSDALAGAYKQLGYESGASALQSDGLRGVMERLRTATGGNITELLALFPNIRAARGALALMAADGSNYAKVAGEIEDKNKRAGATQKVLNEQMKGAGAQWEILKNQADAAAIRLGLAVIPALTDTMHWVTGLGAGLGELGQKLEPAFHGMAEAGKGLVDVFGQIWGIVGPVVSTLGRLALGGTIAGINGLATALGGLLHWLGSSPAASAALISALAFIVLQASGATTAIAILVEGIKTGQAAAAVGAIGFGGVSSAMTAIWSAGSLAVQVVVAAGAAAAGSVEGMAALGIATEAAQTAMRGLFATVGPLLAVAAVVGAIVSMSHLGDAAKDAQKSIDDLMKPVEGASTNVDRMNAEQKAIDGLREKADKAELQLQAYQQRGTLQKIWEWTPDPTKTDSLNKAAHSTEYALKQVEDQLSLTKNNADALGKQYGMTSAEVVQFADKHKIDLGQALDIVQGKFKGVFDAAKADAPDVSTKQLITAMGTLADTSKDADDKLKALKDTLDGLGGKSYDVFEAQAKMQEAVEKAKTALKDQHGQVLDSKGGLNAYTAAGRAAGDTLVDMSQKSNDVIVAMVKTGHSTDEVTAKDAELRASFVKTAESMGINADRANKLADQIMGVPSDRATAFSAMTGDAGANVAQLAQMIDKVKDKTVTISVEVADKATAILKGFTTKLTADFGFAFHNREGGLYQPGADGRSVRHFAGGGITPMPTGAMIAPDGADLYHWAERGTGGEAFVPLGDRHAPRSKELASWLYSYFFPGTTARAFALGGVAGSPSGYTASVPPVASSPTTVSAPISADVRVFLGDRELTDIVKVTVDSRLGDTVRAARARGAR